MAELRKRSIKTVGLALASWALIGAQAGDDPAVIRSSHVLSNFIASARACGLELNDPPTMVVTTDPGIIFYQSRDNTVNVSRWQDMPPPLQGFVTEWSKQGTLGLDAPEMFSEIFNSLLVAHELGHYLQGTAGRLTGDHRTLDHWEAETEANEIAIAFWATVPESETSIADRVANFDRFLNALPSPVPSGEDPHAYFEANYERLSSDPQAYGWYQGAFMRAAWANRAEHDFCGWTKANAPAGPSTETPEPR